MHTCTNIHNKQLLCDNWEGGKNHGKLQEKPKETQFTPLNVPWRG